MRPASLLSDIRTAAVETRDTLDRWRRPPSLRAKQYLALLAGALVAGVLVGLGLTVWLDIPAVARLEDYRPSVVTEVYGDDDRLISQFYLERRKLVATRDMPAHLRRAVVSAEDRRFYEHAGVDWIQVAVAAWQTARHGRVVRGASTITMQLSRNLFLNLDRNWSRKIREVLLAFQIERHYSKEHILTLYLNRIYFGHGNYGVGAAAEYYFGKPVHDLSPAESALLAGIIRNPAYYSPLAHPDRAWTVRNRVLHAMRRDGNLSERELRAALSEPVRLSPQPSPDGIAPYFREMVRLHLARHYSNRQVLTEGLKVYTTLNPELQRCAEAALDDGLRTYDRRHGWRGALPNVTAAGVTDLAGYDRREWRRPVQSGSRITGLVLTVTNRQADVQVGAYRAVLDAPAVAWTRRTDLRRLVRPGDLVPLRVRQVYAPAHRLVVELDQRPEAQGACLVLDNRTGAIKALVGGADWAASQLNRATQTRRQTGSVFKPFVYATALMNGLSLDDTILDEPVTVALPDGTEYIPRNFQDQYRGAVTLHEALARSLNVPAVRLGQHVGMARVIRTARALGVTAPIPPYPSTALGAAEISLAEMVSAYTAFPTGGLRADPYFIRRIEDFQGRVLEVHAPAVREVMPEAVAWALTGNMREVISYGTGVKARALGSEIAGKSGTTNRFADAWFIGFTPGITAGVWVGYDDNRTLGANETGSAVALPVWIRIIAHHQAGHPGERFPEAATPHESPDGEDLDDGAAAPPFQLARVDEEDLGA
ncbi:MAG: PBP1A family penicillin-binding protein [Acidobacteria bacterium]|nr:PBP1A family penicillin-binding protein [Acidobacteriota bacterium]